MLLSGADECRSDAHSDLTVNVLHHTFRRSPFAVNAPGNATLLLIPERGVDSSCALSGLLARFLAQTHTHKRVTRLPNCALQLSLIALQRWTLTSLDQLSLIAIEQPTEYAFDKRSQRQERCIKAIGVLSVSICFHEGFQSLTLNILNKLYCFQKAVKVAFWNKFHKICCL